MIEEIEMEKTTHVYGRSDEPKGVAATLSVRWNMLADDGRPIVTTTEAMSVSFANAQAAHLRPRDRHVLISIDNGATVGDIVRRTGLSVDRVNASLGRLRDRGLAELAG